MRRSTPVIPTPAGIFRNAPNPARRSAAELLCGVVGQQAFVDGNRARSMLLATDKPGRPKLSAIKLMKTDRAIDAESEAIKARYAQLFRV